MGAALAGCGQSGGGEAARIVQTLRGRANSPLGPALAERITRRETGLQAEFGATADKPTARVTFPTRSSQRVRVEDVASGAMVEFGLRGGGDVEAETADGYVVYGGGPG